jgi:AraC-like DNA-binding protein
VKPKGITDAMFVADQFKALGVMQPRNSDDAVYECFCDFWKKNKRPPTLIDIARQTGISSRTVQGLLHDLVAANRLFRVERRLGKANGYYVPIVKPRKA